MTFEIEKFVASPTQRELMTLKKDKVILIVKHYKLVNIKRSMRKTAIYNSLLRYFVEHGVFEDSALEILVETAVGSKFSEQLAMRKAAICNSLLRYFVEQEIFEDNALKIFEEAEVGS